MVEKARGYALAALLAAAVILLREFLGLVASPPPFITFFPAILIAGWFWGRGPAILAVLVCSLASWYLRMPPDVPGSSSSHLIDYLLFVIGGAILAVMSASFREARATAEAEHQRLMRFFDHTGDAFMAFDAEWRYVYVNVRAAHFARLPAEAMIGRTIFELFPDIRTVPFFVAAEQVMRERVRLRVESYYPRLDIWFENDIFPVDDGIGVFYRDVTERKRAAEEREQLLQRERAALEESKAANRVKDEFLTTLSHELRTPLNAIVGWATVLAQGKLDGPSASRAVETIQRNARTQAALIDDLLDLSRVTSGKLRLDVKPVEIGTLLTDALESVRPAADAKGVRLHVTLDPSAGIVHGDSSRLQQVAWNLLSNAIKFTPQGGDVRLAVRRLPAHLELTVTDTGMGIPPQMLHRIFDRFAQVDSTSTRSYQGLGIGLALVRHLVEAHGGSVSAASQGEGLGATFTVVLPLPTEPV